MSCTNCYNGCSEITSDQCVKYTGIDVPALGISNGDTLATVEQAIIDFLVPTLNGTGINPVISPSVLCDLVKSYLPSCTVCTGFTLNQVLTAIIQSVCNLQTQINTINNTLAVLNADYSIGCLTGVTASSDTHAIVQAVINKLCSLEGTVGNIITDLNNYVLISDLNTYIQEFIDNTPGTNLVCNKMVPYSIIPFYAKPSVLVGKFDMTGAGLGDWANIYVCNGYNPGVPDLRGRVVVGATTMGTNSFPTQTDPSLAFNPTYAVGDTPGTNSVALTSQDQLPPHTHTINTFVNFNDPGHFHNIKGGGSGEVGPDIHSGPSNGANTTTNTTGITIGVTATADVVGSGLPHNNYQPGFGLYYIIYIPA